MTNAKQELLEQLKDKSPIKCVYIYRDKKEFILKQYYTESEYEKFLSMLDFNYYDGYGNFKINGTVWLEDGSWLSRGKANGSEWWIYNISPDIPKKCLSNKPSIKEEKKNHILTIKYTASDNRKEKRTSEAKISINNPFLKHITNALDNLREVEGFICFLLDYKQFKCNLELGNINRFQYDLLCILNSEYGDDDDEYEYVDDAYSKFLEKYNYEVSEANIEYLEEFEGLIVSTNFYGLLRYKGYKLK